MDDKKKTKEQLVTELEELRKRNRGLEVLDFERKKAEEALRKMKNASGQHLNRIRRVCCYFILTGVSWI